MQNIQLLPVPYSEWELRLIELDAKAGKLTPAIVVEDARSKTSPLHGMFVWDDSEAAEAYREMQARALIRRVHVTMVNLREETETEVRVFHSVAAVDEDGVARKRYVNIDHVLRDADMTAQMLEAAKKELAAFRRKYAILSELSRVFTAIDEIT